MSEEESNKEELKPKEKLEDLMSVLIAVGILFLIVAILAYLWMILQEPLYILSLIIWNNLTKIIGEGATIFLLSALIFFIAAGIVKMGTFLKDEDEQKEFKSSIEFFWIIDLIGLTLLGILYVGKAISMAAIISFGFVTFIAPLIAMIVLKVIWLISDKIQQNHND